PAPAAADQSGAFSAPPPSHSADYAPAAATRRAISATTAATSSRVSRRTGWNWTMPSTRTNTPFSTKCMEVDVEIEGPAEALHDRHGAPPAGPPASAFTIGRGRESPLTPDWQSGFVRGISGGWHL